MRRRVILVTAAATALLFGMMSATAGVLITPTKILGGPEYQKYASSNGTYLGWTQNSATGRNRWNAYVSTNPGVDKTRLNEAGTKGWFGDIDTDSNEAVYQQVAGSVSDIYLVDVTDPSGRQPAPDINTPRWEWQPRLSDEYMMFTRVFSSFERMYLYDRASTQLTVLREFPLQGTLLAGDVGSLYATWTICRRNCTAWIYDIVAQQATKIPTINDKPQYSPTVDEVHLNAYWVRSRNACGANVDFLRAPIADLGSAVKVAELPPGFDTDARSSLEFDSANNRIDLLFPRYNCRTGDANIYELQGVDSLV